MQRVQTLMRPPIAEGSATHWRLGYLRLLPVGLNFVARTRFEYPPATLVPLSQSLHVLVDAIRFSLVTAMLSWGESTCKSISYK